MPGNAFGRFKKPAPKPKKRPSGNPNPSPETRLTGPLNGGGFQKGQSGHPSGIPTYVRHEELYRFCQKLLKVVDAHSPESYRIALEGLIEATKVTVAKACDPNHPEQLEATKILTGMAKEAQVYAVGHPPKEATINVNTTSQVNVRPVDLPGMVTELSIFERRTQMIHAVLEEERAELIESVATPAAPNGDAQH